MSDVESIKERFFNVVEVEAIAKMIHESNKMAEDLGMTVVKRLDELPTVQEAFDIAWDASVEGSVPMEQLEAYVGLLETVSPILTKFGEVLNQTLSIVDLEVLHGKTVH